MPDEFNQAAIFNADDYGLTSGVSAGIRFAYRNGLVTSTSVVMNAPAVGAALLQAGLETPLLGMGVHLNLTYGEPVLDADKIPGLTKDDATFLSRAEITSRVSRLDFAQVSAEWRAQIERFVQMTGRRPDHLDSHHYISYLDSGIFKTMLELAYEYECPIRMPLTHLATTKMGALNPPLSARMLIEAPRLLRHFGVRSTQHCITAFYDQHATPKALRNILLRLEPGATEIVCHPGYADQELLQASSYNQQREKELSLLTDPDMVQLAQDRGIQLIQFSNLAPHS